MGTANVMRLTVQAPLPPPTASSPPQAPAENTHSYVRLSRKLMICGLRTRCVWTNGYRICLPCHGKLLVNDFPACLPACLPLRAMSFLSAHT